MCKLLIVHILRAPVGGIRKHVVDILEAFGGLNVEQIFITNLREADKDLSHLNMLPNLKIYNINIFDKPSIDDIINIYKIYFLLRKFNIDVIHGHGAKGGVYARILGLFFGTRAFYTPHGGSLHRVFGKVKSVIYDSLEKILAPLTTKFIFESKYSSQEFLNNIKNVSEKMVINHNGVDLPNIFKTTVYQPHSTIKFASFGLLRELKGHDIFIKALARLKQIGIPFLYVIYGSGEFRYFLEQLIDDLNLSEHVFIRPFVSEVYSEMILYDFIVHPSRFESFGYVPIEAMAVGVPVISSVSGGLREVVDAEVALIAPSNDIDEYVDIVMRCFNGDEDLFTLRNNAKSRVIERFSKSRMTDVLLANYVNAK
jgi:glycosyltransferase involved in cell wall biosynthesis